jgi:glycerol-3-phosphate O-acyltransferase / dihydroxyacetone phosphate acyltransferase
VARFVLRNGVALVFGLPLFLVGCVLFGIPFLLVRYAARFSGLAKDRIATLKLIGALVLTPIWQALLAFLAWRAWGTPGLVTALVCSFPLALYTRYFLERRRASIRDAFTFLQLSNRVRLKATLLVEGERLAGEIERIALELRPRVFEELPPSQPQAS